MFGISKSEPHESITGPLELHASEATDNQYNHTNPTLHHSRPQHGTNQQQSCSIREMDSEETTCTYAYAATYNICKSKLVYHLSLDGQNEKMMVF
jgi:hypothetical protein